MVRVFSDNAIIVSTGGKEDSALLFKVLLSNLQRTLLEDYGVLVRGGVTSGEVYMDEDMVFGQGLIDCVGLERKACFPRIIIDEEVVAFFINDGYLYVEKGFDEHYEIVYLHDEYDDGSLDLMKTISDLVCKNCMDCQDKTQQSIKERSKIIEKHIWLIDTYNTYHLATQIEYQFIRENDYYVKLTIGNPNATTLRLRRA